MTSEAGGAGCGSPACPSSSNKETPSPSGRSRTRTTTRTNVASVSRSPIYVDDATLNAMMSNLETFGHGLGQFSPQRPVDRFHGTGRVPFPQPNLVGELASESYGPEYGPAWPSQNESEFPEILKEEVDSSGSLLTENELTPKITDETIKSKKQESIIEWFDRSVEKELEKRRDIDPLVKKRSPCAEKAEKSKSPEKKSPGAMRGLAEATASGVEIIGELLHEKDAELLDAVEKLATAEAMCDFAGAVEAAEEAARSVPLDCAEEAAAAGARGYHREITNVVKQTIPGDSPIEVLGYIGVTRPKSPKKPNH